VEILECPEIVKPGEIVISLQRWYPSKQELDLQPTTLVVSGGSNYFSLRSHVSATTSIPFDHIYFAKPRLYQLKNKHTLGHLVNWNINLQESKLEDGDLILFKDVKDPEVSPDGPPTSGPTNQKNQTKEVGIKIYTIYDQEGREKFKELQKETQEVVQLEKQDE